MKLGREEGGMLWFIVMIVSAEVIGFFILSAGKGTATISGDNKVQYGVRVLQVGHMI